MMTENDRYWAARKAEELAYVKQYERDFGKATGRELADHEGW